MSKPTIADKKPTVLELDPGETMTFTAKKTHLFSSNNFLLGKNNNWIKWSANLILVAVVGIIIYFMAIHNTNHLSSMPMTHHHDRHAALPFISLGITSMGIISIGIVPMGIISIGVVPMGLLSFGTVAMGLFSMGLVSMGAISTGVETMGLIKQKISSIKPTSDECQ